jgi:hypothetical protein
MNQQGVLLDWYVCSYESKHGEVIVRNSDEIGDYWSIPTHDLDRADLTSTNPLNEIRAVPEMLLLAKEALCEYLKEGS